jgi:hypothetical protein
MELTPAQVKKMIDEKISAYDTKKWGFRSVVAHDTPADFKSIGSLGFQITVTGSKAANAALASLIAALVKTGLIVDNTS